MKPFLTKHAQAILCCIAAIICAVIYGCSTRYTAHVSTYRGFQHTTVIDRWTGKTEQR